MAAGAGDFGEPPGEPPAAAVSGGSGGQRLTRTREIPSNRYFARRLSSALATPIAAAAEPTSTA